MIDWENGEITSEYLSAIETNDTIAFTLLSKENDQLKRQDSNDSIVLLKNKRDYFAFKIKIKIWVCYTALIRKFSYEVPMNNNHEHDIQLNESNKNTKWQDVIAAEQDHQIEHETYKDLSRKTKAKPTPNLKKTMIHFIYGIKHDGLHNARISLHSYLTSTPLISAYSGVVSLKEIRVVLVLSELNGIKSWEKDIGNACLEAKTK